MKLSRPFKFAERKEGDTLETYIDKLVADVEKTFNDVRAVVNANESMVLLAAALPKPSREYRGLLVQLTKAPAAPDELWVGIQTAGGDTFVQIV